MYLLHMRGVRPSICTIPLDGIQPHYLPDFQCIAYNLVWVMKSYPRVEQVYFCFLFCKVHTRKPKYRLWSTETHMNAEKWCSICHWHHKIRNDPWSQGVIRRTFTHLLGPHMPGSIADTCSCKWLLPPGNSFIITSLMPAHCKANASTYKSWSPITDSTNCYNRDHFQRFSSYPSLIGKKLLNQPTWLKTVQECPYCLPKYSPIFDHFEEKPRSGPNSTG